MRSLALGRSGLSVTPVVFGGMDFLGNRAEHDAERVAAIHAALDRGVNAIDTAPLYGFGHGEEVVGRALAGARRGAALVLTKVGLAWDGEHGDVLFEGVDAGGVRRRVRRDARPAAVRRDVEASLRRLGVETLDLVQVHHRDRLVPIADTMGALLDLAREGKLRAIGVSNHAPAEVEEAARALGDFPLANVQDEYSLLARQPEAALLPLARRAGLGVLAFSPLGRGLLTGRALPGRRFAPHDYRGGEPLFQRANLERVGRALDAVARPIAAAHGVTLAQLALAWVLAQPGVTAVIAGARTPAQAAENAAAASVHLRADEVEALARGFAALDLDRGSRTGLPARAARLLGRVVARARRAAGSAGSPA